MNKKTLKLCSKRHLKHLKQDTYICCRIQENTEENLRKVLHLLSEITNDEHYYNYELSNTTDKIYKELKEAALKLQNKYERVRIIYT